MPLSTKTKRHYAEVTPHTLHAVRTAGTTLEFCQECAIDNKTAVTEIIHAWNEGESVSAVAAVAPQPVCWHLSDREQARRLRVEPELRRFATRLPHGFRLPLEVIGCNATDGMPVAPDNPVRWLLGVTPANALAAAAAEAIERGIVTSALGSATLGRIAAAATAVRLDGAENVLLWDIGRGRSHLFTLSAFGVESVTACAIGFDALAAVLQRVLGAKTPAAATRLFFSDPPIAAAAAARIISELAPRVKAALASVPVASGPMSFACTGLTHQQDWFAREMARAVGLPLWAPNLNRYLQHLQLDAAPGLESTPSVPILGALYLAAAQAHGSPAWSPAWGAISRHAVTPAMPADPRGGVSSGPWPPVIPVTASSAENGSNIARESTPNRDAASTEPLPAVRNAPSSPTIIAVPAGRVAAARENDSDRLVDRPLKPLPVSDPRITARSAAPVTNSPATRGAAEMRPAATTIVAPPAMSPSSSPLTPPPPRTAAPAPAATPPREPVVVIVRKRGYGAYVGVILALAGAAAAAKFYRDAEAVKLTATEEKRAAAEAKTAATQELAAAEEQVQEAEQRARAVALASAAEAERVRRDAEAARESAVAAARREAAEQTRRQMTAELDAARPANSPGILRIATSPAGAEVAVDGRPPKRAPAAMEGLPPGLHRVKIALAGHVPVELDATIEGAKTTDLGLIKLERATGTVSVSSTPPGTDFSIHSTNTPAEAAPLRRGRTPAQLGDLPAGDYLIRFKRPGWPEQTERITVRRGATVRAATTFQPATVTITSTPAGATVTRGGEAIGNTPLTLRDLPPQEVTYELRAEGYEPLPLKATPVAGREIRMGGELLSEDRLASLAELRTPPRPFLTPPPKLGRRATAAPAQVTMSFVVTRDGTLRDVSVVGSVERDIARRCVEAVKQWKFYPGISQAGNPVNVRVSLPIDISG